MLKQLTLAAAFLLASATAFAAANPQVQIDTNLGSITVELYPDKAPKTVDNFLHYVSEGFYNGTTFHRVISDFVIQGGGYSPALEPKQPDNPPIANEAANGLLNSPGTIAMARGPQPDSATSQFFINLDDNLHLNHYGNDDRHYGYCVFGKVVKGLDIAKKIGSLPAKQVGQYDDVPLQPVVIQKVALLTPAAAAAASSKKPASSKKKRSHSKPRKAASTPVKSTNNS